MIKKKSPDKLQKDKTLSRREALKRIALGVPMIALLPSFACGETEQNINSRSSSFSHNSSRGYTGIQYKLRESNLIDLQKRGIEEGLIKKLHPLIGKWFPKEQLAVEIEELIGKADAEVYFPIIINIADHARFNRGVQCGQYLSCAGMTVTGDCCDDRIIKKEYYRSYSSLYVP